MTSKLDPISQKEYYRLSAILNDDYEAISWVYSGDQLKKIAQIEGGLDRFEKIATVSPIFTRRFSSNLVWIHASSR
jgi:hypothetical protein